MWRALLVAHPGAMHPYHHIILAEQHVADMQAAAHRHRLVRRSRRAGGVRSPAPPEAGVEPIPLPFLTAPNWRRPAA
jgi:hypothetical protein